METKQKETVNRRTNKKRLGKIVLTLLPIAMGFGCSNISTQKIDPWQDYRKPDNTIDYKEATKEGILNSAPVYSAIINSL